MDISLDGKTDGRKDDSGDGVLGEGQQPPPHQLGSLGERCAKAEKAKAWYLI